jgi:nitrous oxidase accessory protein NosD
VRGFNTGIQLASAPGARGNVVEGIRAEGNTVVGISVGGIGAVVRGNLVVDTGGSSLLPDPRAYGISAFVAPGAVIEDNDVVDTATTDAASFDYGIWVANSSDVLIEGNRVRNPNPTPAYTFGILVTFGPNTQVVDNRISSAATGITYVSGSTGKYRDNLTDNCATPFSGGTDAGGNN